MLGRAVSLKVNDYPPSSSLPSLSTTRYPNARENVRLMFDIAALADAFIEDSVYNGSEPFRVAWIRSDTTYSINYLKDGAIDVAITYSPAAERIAIEQGIALSPSYYAWRDHFLIVGPPSDPAKISGASDIYTVFSDLHEAAEAANTTPPVRFLSRYDKSATNIKESELWIGIGQVCCSFLFTAVLAED